jgi:hypothetical protein
MEGDLKSFLHAKLLSDPVWKEVNSTDKGRFLFSCALDIHLHGHVLPENDFPGLMAEINSLYLQVVLAKSFSLSFLEADLSTLIHGVEENSAEQTIHNGGDEDCLLLSDFLDCL